MKMAVLTKVLVHSLKKVAKVVPDKHSTPVLSNVLLAAQGNGSLGIGGSDLKVSISEVVGTEDVKEPGAILVNCKYLHGLVQKMTTAKIHLETVPAKNVLLITSGMAEYEVPYLSPDEYPAMTEVKDGKSFWIMSDELKGIIEKVSHATLKTDERPALTGIYFKIQSGVLSAYATDSHKLSKVTLTMNEATEDLSFLISGKDSKVLLDFPDGIELCVSVDESKVLFASDHLRVVIRMIDATYPDCERILQNRVSNGEFVAGIESFKDALERAMLVDDEKPIVLKKEGNQIFLTRVGEKGRSKEIIDGQGVGDWEIIMNPSYVLDVCKTMTTEQIRLEFQAYTAPLYFYGVGDESSLHLVLPCPNVQVQKAA